MDFQSPVTGISFLVRQVAPPTCFRRSMTRPPPCHDVTVNQFASLPFCAFDSWTVALTCPGDAGVSDRRAASGDELRGIGNARQNTATAPAAIATPFGIGGESSFEVS